MVAGSDYWDSFGKRIFVFGSNEKGFHGAGAANFALRYYGAKWGNGEGYTGNSYAIPTKVTPYENRELELVRISVEKFLDYAAQHQELHFQITNIGCGLAGFKVEQIAPLFKKLPANCAISGAFTRINNRQNYVPKILIYGNLESFDHNFIQEKLNFYFSRFIKEGIVFEVINLHLDKEDRALNNLLFTKHVNNVNFRLNIRSYQRESAVVAVIQDSLWYATHAIIFNRGQHENTQLLLKIIKSENEILTKIIE